MMIEELLLGLQVGILFLLITFLWVFLRLYRGIRPLLEKFSSPRGGFKMPTIKEAIGYGIAKAVDTVDFGQLLGLNKRS